MVLGGIVWGLWHAPLTVQGHNYGLSYPGYPWTGILLMCLFCIFAGICLMWLTVKSGSIWPAALCHGTLNAVGAVPALFLKSGYPIASPFSPTAAGLISLIPMGILALLAARNLLREKP